MPIPNFQTVMRPLLDKVQNGDEYRNRDLVDALATEFNLTDEEQKEMLPSGQQEVFANRVGWAKTYLKIAGLLENTARGVFRITDRGRQVLAANPTRIDLKVLRAEPAYAAAQAKKAERAEAVPADSEEESKTPEEAIEESYQAIREGLGSDLLQRLKTGSPAFFERLVVELLVKMGYGGSRIDAGKAIGRSGDEGVDGIINEDRLGLDSIYLQAKRWEGTVSRPEIQKFAGALQGFRAKKGIFITTSTFSKEAIDYASKIESKIVLIDGERLWGLMLDQGIGVTTVATYAIQRVDNDFFSEEG
jgi:restriction system protein